MLTFIAKYASGVCAECQSQIKAGEELSRNLDQDYVHVEYPETELDRLVNRPVCTSCWLIKPCDCE